MDDSTLCVLVESLRDREKKAGGKKAVLQKSAPSSSASLSASVTHAAALALAAAAAFTSPSGNIISNHASSHKVL